MNSQNLLRHGAKEKMQNLKNKKNSSVKSCENFYSLKAHRNTYFHLFSLYCFVQICTCTRFMSFNNTLEVQTANTEEVQK